MISSNKAKEIAEIWNELCRDPAAFLRSRDPLEDEFVECKGAVFSEPLYDEVNAFQGKSFKSSNKILHDNLFRAIEAIASIANTGGGIVIFGVVSAMEDSFPDDGKPLAEKGMKGKELLTKYMRRERGVRLGKALVIGLDKEIPEKRESGPADAPMDKYMQRIFGPESFLWGKHVYEGKTLLDSNDWYKFVPKDAEDDQSYPAVEEVLWMRAKWSDGLGPRLFAGGRLLKVENDMGNVRWIAAIKVGLCHSDTLVHYVKVPFLMNGKKQSKKATDKAEIKEPIVVPFHYPGEIQRVRFRSRADLQILTKSIRKGVSEGKEFVRAYKPGLDLVPTHFRKKLKAYVVPTIDGEDLPAKIKKHVNLGENVFVLGDSGLGKSLLMSHCYLNYSLEGYCCFYSIAGEQGPEVWRSAHVLRELRKQVQRLEGLQPQQSESIDWVSEKQSLESVLRDRSQVSPDQKLTIYLDGLDENYMPNKKNEFILKILKDLIQDSDLGVTWVLSSQRREGEMDWINDYFQILTIEGLGFREAKTLLLNKLPQTFDTSNPDCFNGWLESSKMESGFYDPDMLVSLGGSITKRLGAQDGKMGFILSDEKLKSRIGKLPLNPGEKHQYYFKMFCEDLDLRNDPSLKKNAEKWDEDAKSILQAQPILYAEFLCDILTVLALIRKPIPCDILAWAMDLEDKNPKTNHRGSPTCQFTRYPKELIENREFLQTALKDLQMFVTSVEEKEDIEEKSYSLCKPAIGESFRSFVKKGKKKSAKARLAALAIEEIGLVQKDNLENRPAYLLLELFYFLSLKPEDMQIALERLFWLDNFPEWLQQRAISYGMKQWIPDFIDDLELFDGLSNSLRERLNTVKTVLLDRRYHLNNYPDVIASFIRNNLQLNEIWRPTGKDRHLLLPASGYYSRKRMPHYGIVRCVEVLRDGSLVTGSEDGTIRIWDVDSGKCKLVSGETFVSSVEDIKVLSDGRVVTTSGGRLGFWNMDTGEFAEPKGSYGSVDRLAVLSDGRLISESIWEDDADGLRIWELGHHPESKLLDLEDVELLSCVDDYYSIDLPLLLVDGRGRRLASGCSDGKIRIWDIKNHKPKVFEACCDSVDSLALFPPDRLASGCSDGKIRIWDTHIMDSEDPQILEGHSGPVHCLARLPGPRLASAGSDGKILIWDINTENSKPKVIAEHWNVFRLRVLQDPDGHVRLISLSECDKEIHIWDVDRPDPQHKKIQVSESSDPHKLSTVYFKRDSLLPISGSRVASGSEDGVVRIWDVDTAKTVKALQGHSQPVKALELLPGNSLASGSVDGSIRIWNLDTRESILLKEQSRPVCGLIFLSHGRLVSSGSMDGAIQIWDLNTRKFTELEAAKDSWRDSMDGQLTDLSLFNKANFQPRPLAALSLCHLASGSMDGTIRIWDVDTGKTVKTLQGHSGPVDSLAILGDGRLVSSGEDKTVRIWDLTTGKESMVLPGHSRRVEILKDLGHICLALSNEDGTIRIWDVDTGKESMVLKGHSRGVEILKDLRHGRLASSSRDNTIRIWDLGSGEEVAIGFLEANPNQIIYLPGRRYVVVGTFAGFESFKLSS